MASDDKLAIGVSLRWKWNGFALTFRGSLAPSFWA